MTTLKIPKGNSNFSLIAQEMRHVPDTNLQSFYKDAVSSDNFGNGIKAVIEAAAKHKNSEIPLWINALKKRGVDKKDIYRQLLEAGYAKETIRLAVL